MHEHPTGGIAPVDSSMLVAIPRYVPDADAPYAITRRLLDALAPGSHLVLSHPAADIGAEAVAASMRVYNERAADHTGATPPGTVRHPPAHVVRCRPQSLSDAPDGSLTSWRRRRL